MPTAFSSFNVDLNRYVSFHWDKRMWALFPGDRTKATETRWLLQAPPVSDSHDVPMVSNVPHSIKRPLENREWFAYPGQGSPTLVGSHTGPAKIARVLDDSSSQIYQATYNSRNLPLTTTDPAGRRTTYVYDTNDLDLLQIKQTTGSANDVLTTYANYTSGHHPQTVTDASGQVTTLTYNSSGQVTTVTNAKSETTTFTYTNGYLTQIQGPVASATVTLGYDDYGRLETVTDPDGYTTTNEYDSLGRLLKITYPDDTFEEVTYNRLDVSAMRNREGHWSRFTYDRVGRLTSARDPKGRTVRKEWCACGSLDKVVDANGHETTWQRDAGGRVTQESHGALVTTYAYENTTGRLHSVTDPKSQIATYAYGIDDALASVTYTNSTVTTSAISYAYDPVYPRLSSMTDGTGTTTLTYKSVGTAGAGLLATVDGPLTNDLVSYSYDELGRVTGRTVNGVGLSVVYDTLGRIQQETNPLGVFGFTYEGASQRLATVNYPNGQTTTYGYAGILNDNRVSSIHHKDVSATTLSQFTYLYDAAGRVRERQVKYGTAAPTVWEYRYDQAGQLIDALHRTTATPAADIARYAYSYDASNNRVSEQIDDAVRRATHDAHD